MLHIFFPRLFKLDARPLRRGMRGARTVTSVHVLLSDVILPTLLSKRELTRYALVKYWVGVIGYARINSLLDVSHPIGADFVIWKSAFLEAIPIIVFVLYNRFANCKLAVVEIAFILINVKVFLHFVSVLINFILNFVKLGLFCFICIANWLEWGFWQIYQGVCL